MVRFEFDELPLIEIIENQKVVFSDGLVGGEAIIRYGRDGDWHVDEILLGGRDMPGTHPLYDILAHRITQRYAAEIEDMVRQQMADDGYPLPRRRGDF
jgi:hypothetical protein